MEKKTDAKADTETSDGEADQKEADVEPLTEDQKAIAEKAKKLRVSQDFSKIAVGPTFEGDEDVKVLEPSSTTNDDEPADLSDSGEDEGETELKEGEPSGEQLQGGAATPSPNRPKKKAVSRKAAKCKTTSGMFTVTSLDQEQG